MNLKHQLSQCWNVMFHNFQLKLVLKILRLGRKCFAPKKPRKLFRNYEDIVLIQTWINISKGLIVGNDQKADKFWLRIAANYNQYPRQLREKDHSKLKYQFHRISGLVQKFVGCSLHSSLKELRLLLKTKISGICIDAVSYYYGHHNLVVLYCNFLVCLQCG